MGINFRCMTVEMSRMANVDIMKNSKRAKKNKGEKVNVAQNNIIRGQSGHRPWSVGEKFNMMNRDVIHSYTHDQKYYLRECFLNIEERERE